MKRPRREVHVARAEPIAAAAKLTGEVEIWNIETGAKLSEFLTVFDGMNRLAIRKDGARIATANWKGGERGGIACYDTASGKSIWHRPDLAQVQHMRFGELGEWIWCEVEQQPAHLLNSLTGETLTRWEGVRDVLESPCSTHCLATSNNVIVLSDTQKRSTIKYWEIPHLRAAFGPDFVCLVQMIFDPVPEPPAASVASTHMSDKEKRIASVMDQFRRATGKKETA
jgi:hypothetical protein